MHLLYWLAIAILAWSAIDFAAQLISGFRR